LIEPEGRVLRSEIRCAGLEDSPVPNAPLALLIGCGIRSAVAPGSLTEVANALAEFLMPQAEKARVLKDGAVT
jgi:hypothetical protein